MTDHDNADDADGQNSKLSRRTALGLMGASAVGGAAASSAYSELMADRPIDVQVVDNGDAETADSGSSELQITNNTTDNTTFDVDLSTSDDSVNPLTLTGSSTATRGGLDPWTISSLESGDTAQLEFVRTDSSSNVTFDIDAFSQTSGFSVANSQDVSVNGPPNGAVSRWTFDTVTTDDSAETTFDVWGGKDGAFAGSPSTGLSSPVGEAIGTSDGYIEVSDATTFDLTTLTVTGWIYVNSNSTGGIAHVWQDQDDGRAWSLDTTDLNLRWVSLDSNGDSQTFSTGSNLLSTDQWYFVAARWENEDRIRIDVDDTTELDTSHSTALTSTNVDQDTPLWISVNAGTDASSRLDGRLSDVRIYDRILSDSELSDLYNAGDTS